LGRKVRSSANLMHRNGLVIYIQSEELPLR
jgi:hypothetical protein